MDAESKKKKIALIGAFNDDYFVKERVPQKVSELLEKAGIPFHGFRENAIPSEIGAKVLSEVYSKIVKRALGGAMYNTLRGLSQYAVDIELTVIGSLSKDVKHGHKSALELLNIDQEWLTTVQERSALSICFEHDGGRTLLTTPASNSSILNLLANRKSELEAELCSTNMIHFNSYIDDTCQRAVADLLRNVLKRAENVQVSFDPGSDWRVGESRSLFDVISLSSILHLKERAFNEIGGRIAGEKRKTVAKRTLNLMRGPTRYILVRSGSDVDLYVNDPSNDVVELKFILGAKKLNSEQVFQTGDGQVFSGVFLASLISPILGAALATRHAMFVMGRSFSDKTTRPECDFPNATDEFLDQRSPSIGLMSSNEYCAVELGVNQQGPRIDEADKD